MRVFGGLSADSPSDTVLSIQARRFAAAVRRARRRVVAVVGRISAAHVRVALALAGLAAFVVGLPVAGFLTDPRLGWLGVATAGYVLARTVGDDPVPPPSPLPDDEFV